MRELEGLILIFIAFYVPLLVQLLSYIDTAQHLFANITVCNLWHTYKCHRRWGQDEHPVLKKYWSNAQFSLLGAERSSELIVFL
jgi:hypothetical protein